jgi:type I restriction enzyme S subunit
MTDLPRGWSWATVDEMAPGGVTDGPFGSNLKTAHYTSRGPRVVRLQNIGDGRFNDEQTHISSEHYERLEKHAVEPGDVLVASLGEVLPRACLAPPSLGPAIVKADCIRVRPHPDISGPYLMWALNSPDARTAVGRSIKGVGRPRVNLGDLRKLELPIAPAAEQQRIVTAVDEAFSKLDAGEAGLRAVQQRIKHMRQAVLAAAVTGRLVSQDPTDTPASKVLADLGVEPDTSADELPVGWAAVTLRGLLQGIEAGRSFATQGRPARHGEIGVIKVSAMTWGEFRPKENKALPPGTSIEQRWVVRAGDLLLSRANTEEYVGACVLVPTDHPGLILSDKSLRLVPAGGIDSRWLLHALRSHQVRAQIEQLATGTKESMRNISQAKLQTLRLSLPPAEEQRRIADEVDRQFSFVEACERAVDAGLARSAGLRRSVLKAAFGGRLVPQDPSDEPAWALLERIRAELAGSDGPGRRRRKKVDAS